MEMLQKKGYESIVADIVWKNHLQHHELFIFEDAGEKVWQYSGGENTQIALERIFAEFR